MIRNRLVSLAFGAVAGISAIAAGAQEIHYSPIENLEHIDLELIQSAHRSIDMAMYTLTDWAIIAALNEARARGVAVRVALDPTVRQAYDKLGSMADIVRVKKKGPLMHLKAYAVDAALLRTGSANLSPSGLKKQDNDLILIRNLAIVAAFEARFAAIYQVAEPMRTDKMPRPDQRTPPDPRCLIKGNVNRKGVRIYHLPGQQSYPKVNMAKLGVRWFCSEDEAKSEGWRASAN